MFGIGSFELFLILLFGFLVFGPDKLPAMAKTLGKAINKFRSAQEEMNKVIKTEVYDPNSDEPFKNPLEALSKVAEGSDDKKDAKQESFSERKAKYGTKPPAKKPAASSSTSGAASAAPTSTAGAKPSAAAAAAKPATDSAAQPADSKPASAAKPAAKTEAEKAAARSAAAKKAAATRAANKAAAAGGAAKPETNEKGE